MVKKARLEKSLKINRNNLAFKAERKSKGGVFLWYIIIGLIILLCLCPVFFAVEGKVDESESMKIELSLFFLPLALFGFKKKIHIRTLGNRELIHWPRIAKDKRKISTVDALKFFKRIIKRVDIRNLNISIDIGTGNAAASCLLAGGLWSAGSGMLGFVSGYFKNFPEPPLVFVQPDFFAKRFFCHFECIFAIRFGDIIFAICYMIWFIISRKGHKKWKDKATSKA